ncbi:hypothetical protein E05_05060 [Plautia stali symbiont]|nr:hypothetical protein E05_05060 [Plautia stali symbiont]
MAIILEVAKKAGVSKATVSRVLSGNGYVSQEKRERVYQAIAETSFRPNLLARNLATKSSQIIGLVITNTLYTGSYFSEMMQHSARILEQQGRQLLLVDSKHSAEEERAAIQFLLDLRCDGVIIYPRFLTIDEMDSIIAQHRHPILVINRRLRQHDSYCIYSDQQRTSAEAVAQLIALGHRDIAFITGSLDSPTGRERLAGYHAALAQHQLAAHNIRVLQQVAVLGFDDIPLAPYTIPALASVRMPVTGMIEETIERLVSMLDGGEMRNRKTFAGELILRESVGPGPFYLG